MKHFYESLTGHFTFPDFYAWVAGQVPDGGRCVEVGVFCGQSAAYLGVELINAEKMRTKLDLVDNSFKEAGIRSALSPIASTIGKVHVGNSAEVARLYADKSCDFVFIDADHSYQAVRADIEAWRPKVKPGGILAGHDITFLIPGVGQAVVEAFDRFEVWRGAKWKDGSYYPVWYVRIPRTA